MTTTAIEYNNDSVQFLDFIDPALLCVIGGIMIIFGLWLYATIYWELRNAPAFHKKLEDIAIKEKNKEKLNFGDRVNLKIPGISRSIAKVSIVSGLITVAIGCILK